MKKGEILILAGIALLVIGSMVYNITREQLAEDRGAREIPFYSDASVEVQKEAASLMKKLDCRQCHSLWAVRDPMQAVPAPALDGLGSLHEEAWFYEYFSAVNPQSIVPTRLKKEYQMPSYSTLPEEQRRTLASYLASLKVKDWYLEETRKREFEKLTGLDYVSENKK